MAPHVHHDHAAHDAHAHRHAHAHKAVGAQRALAIALVLTGAFALVEAAGAWWAGSLALLSDAGHMVTDAASLGLALFAQHVAARPPSHRASYGYARAEVIAAFVNALALLALVVFIAVEAVRRLLEPAPVSGGWVHAPSARSAAKPEIRAVLRSAMRMAQSPLYHYRSGRGHGVTPIEHRKGGSGSHQFQP